MVARIDDCVVGLGFAPGGYAQAPSPKRLQAGVGLTCLVVALLSRPSAGRAAEECGTPNTSGAVTCTSAGNPYPNGINYAVSGALSVTTNSDVVSTGGIRLSGDQLILSHNGAVSTDGAEGVVLQAGSAATVRSASVATAGDRADGIDVQVSSGTLSVTSAAVSTSGANAYGIAANIFYPGVGQVTVASQSVSTTGATATGIQVSSNGAVQVQSGSVVTGTGTGITAYGGSVTINSGSITTGGGYGVSALGAGPVSITSSSVMIQTVAPLSLPQGYKTGPEYPVGIDVYNQAPGPTWVTSTGAITSLTHDSIGIEATGDTSVSVDNSGSILVSAIGISAGSGLSPLPAETQIVNTGPITVTGDAEAPFFVTGPPNTAGISASSFGQMVLSDSGTITVQGQSYLATGLYAVDYADGARLQLQTGTIDVAGYVPTGIQVIAPNGSVTLAAAGPISVSGQGASGISVSAGQGVAIKASAPLVVTSAVSQNLVTYGAQGIFAASEQGPVQIAAQTVSVADPSGNASDYAIGAFGAGAVSVSSGSASTDSGSAIIAQSRNGAASVSVTGATVTKSDSSPATIVVSAATNSDLVVGSAATVSGARTAVSLTSGSGATVENAGIIAGGSASLQTSGGSAVIDNTGLIAGPVLFGAATNTFNNPGVFTSGRDSQFGGAGVLNNSGTVSLPVAAGPQNVTIGGLSALNNTGMIDLRNGIAGDVMAVSGALNGQDGSALALDVRLGPNAQADRLVVGSVSGTTSIVLNTVGGAAGGQLTAPIPVVQVAAGASTNAFRLANGPVVQGFVQFGLSYDAAAGTFNLVGTPDAAAYQTMKLEEGVQNLWHETAQAWSDHLTDLRDGRWGGDRTAIGAGLHSWAQAFGSADSRNGGETVSTFGVTDAVDLSYQQNSIGLEAGFDWVSSPRVGTLVSGVTGGFTTSDLHFNGVGDGADYQASNIGLYSAYLAGPAFVNALVKYDHDVVSAFNATAGYAQGLDGDSYGARIEAGYRWTFRPIYVEPAAELGYVNTHLGGLLAQQSQITFPNSNSLRAQLGLRAGLAWLTSESVRLSPYAGFHAVQELEGRDPVTFQNGGYALGFAGHLPGTSGEGVGGLDFAFSAGLRGFIEGEGRFGGGYGGGGGRLGLRWAW